MQEDWRVAGVFEGGHIHTSCRQRPDRRPRSPLKDTPPEGDRAEDLPKEIPSLLGLWGVDGKASCRLRRRLGGKRVILKLGQSSRRDLGGRAAGAVIV